MRAMERRVLGDTLPDRPRLNLGAPRPTPAERNRGVRARAVMAPLGASPGSILAFVLRYARAECFAEGERRLNLGPSHLRKRLP